MSNFKNIGYFCLVVIIAMELGAIFVNISKGFSAFYLFDFSQKFSTDNRSFLLYWGAAIGCFFLIRDFDSSSVPSSSVPSSSVPSSSVPSPDKILNKDESTVGNVSTSIKEPRDKRSRLVNIPGENDLGFKEFLADMGLSYSQCKHSWAYWRNAYIDWLDAQIYRGF